MKVLTDWKWLTFPPFYCYVNRMVETPVASLGYEVSLRMKVEQRIGTTF